MHLDIFFGCWLLTVPDNLVTQKYDDSRLFLYFVDLGRYLHAQTELNKKLDI